MAIAAAGVDGIYKNVIISNGQSLSATVDCQGGLPAALQTPANIDSATSITFQASYDGSTFANLYDGTGTEYTLTVSTSRSIILPPSDFFGVKSLKVRLGTSGSPTAASADRTLILSLRP